MATHGTLAYKKGDYYYAKTVHYGNIHDVKRHLQNATSADIIKSVNGGNSTSLFAGFYLDEEYCKTNLGWSHNIVDVNTLTTFRRKTLNELIGINCYTYVLEDDYIVKAYDPIGRVLETFDLRNGDGKGAIRDAVDIAFKKKGIGVWMTKDVFQFMAFDSDADKPALFVLTDRMLLKANIEKEILLESLPELAKAKTI